MIYLTLNNGTKIEIEEISTTSSIVVKGNLAKVDTALSEITTDNLKNADLNGTPLINKVYTGFSGTFDGTDYTVTFALRDKTEMEVMQENIEDLNTAVGELGELIGG